jgi:peptidoglycan/LPS O-acetylase OafA/YrhL
MKPAFELGQKRISALDGFRGLAILLVIAFHYFDGLFIFRFGWLGVNMLFVLSGFLIMARLYENRFKPGIVKIYLINRALRIIPLLFIVLLGYFYLLPYVLPVNSAADIVQNKPYAPFYFSFTQASLFVVQGYPAIPTLAFLWSLSVQIHIYLWLAVLSFLPAGIRGLRLLMITCVLLGVLLRTLIRFETTDGSFTAYLYNPLTRMDDFCLGAWLYLHLATKGFIRAHAIRRLTIVALTLVLSIFIFEGVNFTGWWLSTFGFVFIAVAAAGIIYQLLQKRNWLAHFFENAFLRFTGQISYGLYLFHILIFAYASGRLYDFFQKITGAGRLAETLSAVVCVGVSYVTALLAYRFIEQPLKKLKPVAD